MARIAAVLYRIESRYAETEQLALAIREKAFGPDTPFGVCPVRSGTVSTGARGATCSAPQPANVSAAVAWKQTVAP